MPCYASSQPSACGRDVKLRRSSRSRQEAGDFVPKQQRLLHAGLWRKLTHWHTPASALSARACRPRTNHKICILSGFMLGRADRPPQTRCKVACRYVEGLAADHPQNGCQQNRDHHRHFAGSTPAVSPISSPTWAQQRAPCGAGSHASVGKSSPVGCNSSLQAL